MLREDDVDTDLCFQGKNRFSMYCTYFSPVIKIFSKYNVDDSLARYLKNSLSLARQPCPAALTGSLARQPCPFFRIVKIS
jgi:hypothetical protein